jgi:hypothetical protein
METANAFDMLVLPVLQWFAGIFVTFPLLHGIRVGLGRLFEKPESGHVSR